MLKKISHIVSALLLLVSSIGMFVSKHYCHGEFVSVSFFQEADLCCEMPGCCQNENYFYKVKEDYSSPVITNVPLLAELDVFGQDLPAFESLLKEPESEITTSFIDFSPPPKNIQTTLSLKQLYLL